MTRKIIWTLLLIAIAGALAYGMNHYPGSVSFEWFSWRISMSVYVFILLGLIAFTLLFWLWRLYRGMVALPSRFSGWREQKREQRALAALQTATIALQEGRWAHAEKAAKIAARRPEAVGLASLLGAASAHPFGLTMADGEHAQPHLAAACSAALRRWAGVVFQSSSRL